MTISKLISEERDITFTEKVYLLSFALSKKKEEILIGLDRTLSEEQVNLIKMLFNERKKGKPLAYIVKSKEFFSEEFFVNESVLIPRPETEILVEEALNIIKHMEVQPRVLDVGTGSGVIGIIIAKHAPADVVCLDVSLDALKVASINSDRLGVRKKVTFVCSDLLTALNEKRGFHVVVANLPYVKRDEWDNLMKDVKEYEPELALLGGEDGLNQYRRLIDALKGVMVKKGWFLCEIGGAKQAEAISNMLIEKGFTVSIIKDYRGMERIVKAQWINL